MIADHGDLARHVWMISAAPDGSYFIADGVATSDIRSKAIIGYSGRSNEKLWTIPIPESPANGCSVVDRTGRELLYQDLPASAIRASLPRPDLNGVAASTSDRPGIAGKFVFKLRERDMGLSLAVAGTSSPFLTLSPDEPTPAAFSQFTPDGRYLIWGSLEGRIRVAELPRMREKLVSAGFSGW